MEPKPLAYKELPDFLSARQLSEHHDVLYAGYVKKLNEIKAKIETVDLSGANATYSDIRELKIEEGFARNAVKLHELYFENLGGDGVIEGEIKDKIEESFDSVEKWREELVASGISARGWVVLAESEDGELNHFICDMHNQGGIWGARPLLVLDVYEHAYFIDYGTDRKSYLEAFLKNVNWKVVGSRLL